VVGVKFAYYKNLGLRQRRIYDQSDAVTSVPLPAAVELRGVSARLAAALAADDRAATEAAAQALGDGVLRRLHVVPVQVRVLAVRPTTRREELHGLYEYGGRRKVPLVTVWMRTAQRRQVVAFRTFLRTLLHEIVHHLDYQMLKLVDSYHTQGFYKRAESLYRQLAPAMPETTASAPAAATRTPAPRAAPPRPAAVPRRAPAAASPAPAPRLPRRPPSPARPMQPTLFDLD
jgi:hypothetical protein